MGLVIGSDSLVTITNPSSIDRSIVATIPHYSKVFSLEPFAAGVTLNGDAGVAGRTMEDIFLNLPSITKRHIIRSTTVYINWQRVWEKR